MRLSLPAAVLFACPALAQEPGFLSCQPVMACSHIGCFAIDPDGWGESITGVRDATGPAPEVYLGDGLYAAARRSERQGTMTWEGTAPDGDRVTFSVNRQGGAFLSVRHRADGSGNYYQVGTCAG